MIHKDKTRETDNTGNIKTGKMKQLINKVEGGKRIITESPGFPV